MASSQLIFCLAVGTALAALGGVVATQSSAGLPVAIVGAGVLAATFLARRSAANNKDSTEVAPANAQPSA